MARREQHSLSSGIAETEKYAHVTFFFNGGREKPFDGEERILVASPSDVATYDLKPEMSALHGCRRRSGANPHQANTTSC